MATCSTAASKAAKRLGEAGAGYQGRPVHWIRFNPDAFKVSGATRRTKQVERWDVLLPLLEAAIALPDYENLITIDYVCYDKGQPDTGSDLTQTFKFRDYEAYCVWVESQDVEMTEASGSATADVIVPV